MERREAVIKISWILKSVYLAPAIFTGLTSCKSDVSSSHLYVFSENQDKLVRAIADTILPRTETPSASDVEVNLYMDLMLKEVYDDAYKDSFLKGLQQFDENCVAYTDNRFFDLKEAEKLDYLNRLDTVAYGEERAGLEPFYRRFKELVVAIYFSTEEGVKQNLKYVPIPGPYEGDVEVTAATRIMKGN
ncbi:gluconate 2-dehydrogenase subunit 3 family protein [Arenibacter certesii]|uniref:Gluconate 2-dehydrogenase subunit 3 family protein n=1 Tax=Arenibacter certesii TaxID=228955 RepID=A0A918IYU7_9FLAO|nr:gluconate 2-dehydrogenase subunit 3 family protein [Arenibacter certesii]GGW39441.1 hypothetical protein GCM10007383_25220 [Arenibacter certesii]